MGETTFPAVCSFIKLVAAFVVTGFVTASIRSFIGVVFPAGTEELLLFSHRDDEQLMFSIRPCKIHRFLKPAKICIVTIPTALLVGSLPNQAHI